MKLSNATYKVVKMDWDSITLPLKEGSPISAAGAVSNTEYAIGLAPTTIKERPLEPGMYVVVGGDVVLSDVEGAFGDTLSDDAKNAMTGINFYADDGSLTPKAGGGGIFICECTLDDVENETVLDKTWEEIDLAQRDGNLVICVDAESTQGDVQIGYLVHTHEKPDVPDEDDDIYYLATFITATSNTQDEIVRWHFGAEDPDDCPSLMTTQGGGGES